MWRSFSKPANLKLLFSPCKAWIGSCLWCWMDSEFVGLHSTIIPTTLYICMKSWSMLSKCDDDVWFHISSSHFLDVNSWKNLASAPGYLGRLLVTHAWLILEHWWNAAKSQPGWAPCLTLAGLELLIQGILLWLTLFVWRELKILNK